MRMKLFARVLPVDIPLHSLSGTDSVGEHEQGQIDEKIFFLKIHTKASRTKPPFHIQCLT